MQIRSLAEVPSRPVDMAGVRDARIQEVFTGDTGAPHFAMRVFEVAPGGHTPLHRHPYEHEILILEGAGELRGGPVPVPFRQGDALFVEADELHQFANVHDRPLKFLCLIPVAQACAPKPAAASAASAS